MIGRCDPDLSSHLQTFITLQYIHTNIYWCNLTNSENAEQGTGHGGETGTLWTKANRQMVVYIFILNLFWKVSNRQDIKTPSSLKALYLLKQKSKTQNWKQRNTLANIPKSMFRNLFKKGLIFNQCKWLKQFQKERKKKTGNVN